MDKQRAREFLIKSKLYRFLALLFAAAGLVMFGYIYLEQERMGGGLSAAMHDPTVAILIIFPFVPCIVFSFAARSAERKLNETLKES